MGYCKNRKEREKTGKLTSIFGIDENGISVNIIKKITKIRRQKMNKKFNFTLIELLVVNSSTMR